MLSAITGFLATMPLSSILMVLAGLILYVAAEIRKRMVHKD